MCELYGVEFCVDVDEWQMTEFSSHDRAACEAEVEYRTAQYEAIGVDFRVVVL